MNQTEFDKLPALLTRAQVVLCGIPSQSIDELRKGNQISAVQLPSRNCKQAAKAKWKYRKSSVASICGFATK